VSDVPELLVLRGENGERLRVRFTRGSGKLAIFVDDGRDAAGERLRDDQEAPGQFTQTLILHPRWAAELRGWLNAHADQTDGFSPTWERGSRGD
jgi:hypothetical protein